MTGFSLKVYCRLPEFLKRRINPLEFSVESFVRLARPDVSHSVVLDAGSGEARFRKHFLENLYLAFDSGIGDESWDYSNIDICGDLLDIPLVSNSVDVVINTQVLEHVLNPKGVLREVYRVLKDGGHLYLTAPQGWHEHQQPHDFFRFTQFSLYSMLDSVGFREISIEPLGGYFHYLGQRLTYVPKVIFGEIQGITRAILLPLELVSLLSFCVVAPVVCYYLDRLDRKKEFTLCYKCLAVK